MHAYDGASVPLGTAAAEAMVLQRRAGTKESKKRRAGCSRRLVSFVRKMLRSRMANVARSTRQYPCWTASLQCRPSRRSALILGSHFAALQPLYVHQTAQSANLH